MADERIIKVLQKSSWFREVPAEGLLQLEKRAVVKKYKAKQYIYLNGDCTDHIFCVLSGSVRISVTSRVGQVFVLTDLKAYSWLGESSLIGAPNTVQEARVHEDAEIMLIPSIVVNRLADQFPIIYRSLFAHHVRRSQAVYELLTGMLFYPLKSRLAGRLLNLADRYGEIGEQGIAIDVRMSQLDFARMSMGSRQRVNKILRDWKRDGIVDRVGDTYVIKDINALQDELEIAET